MMVEVDRRAHWFFKRWTYVERVVAQRDHLLIYAHPSSPPAAFTIQASFEDRRRLVLEEQVWRGTIDSRPIRLAIPARFQAAAFRFELRLDGHLAYLNYFTSEPEWSLIER